jgi:hypothetical protein
MLVDCGELDGAIVAAHRVAEAAERESVIPSLITARAVLARALSLRGEAEQASGYLDWLEVTARGTGAPEVLIQAGGAAIAWAALGQPDRAAHLLRELAGTAGVGMQGTFAAWLPSLVRTALANDERPTAEGLVARLEPTFPYAQHAQVAVEAALAEEGGDLERAAGIYADATGRWAEFGVIPEEAFASLGRGRCLVRLSRSVEAARDLHRAREIFERLGAVLELIETDALLAQAVAG